MSSFDTFDERFKELIEETANYALHTDDSTAAIKNLSEFSKARPEAPEVEDVPTVPETAWGRFKHSVASVWDNETTRVAIKAGGALAGVVGVSYATIRRDHQLERQALQQANQKPS